MDSAPHPQSWSTPQTRLRRHGFFAGGVFSPIQIGHHICVSCTPSGARRSAPGWTPGFGKRPIHIEVHSQKLGVRIHSDGPTVRNAPGMTLGPKLNAPPSVLQSDAHRLPGPRQIRSRSGPTAYHRSSENSRVAFERSAEKPLALGGGFSKVQEASSRPSARRADRSCSHIGRVEPQREVYPPPINVG